MTDPTNTTDTTTTKIILELFKNEEHVGSQLKCLKYNPCIFNKLKTSLEKQNLISYIAVSKESSRLCPVWYCSIC